MARKDKNDNLKDAARNPEGKRPSQKQKEGSTDCGNSIGILPYLLEAPSGPPVHNEQATDKLSELRRLYKKEFGYKPVGKTEQQLETVLASRGITWD
jgi:hypothetical protein